MACLSPRLIQSEWLCMEQTAVEYLVAQPTPVVNTFKNLNRNTLHRVLNQMANIHDIHVQSLFLALLTDYIACDCREMDIGASGEWSGNLNKNTMQLIGKLCNVWRYNLHSAHQALTREQFQAQIAILKRSADRLSDLNISSSLHDVCLMGQAFLETEPARWKQLPSDFTDAVGSKTPKQSSGVKSAKKRRRTQTFCWQPDSKRALLCPIDTAAIESILTKTSSPGLNLSSCTTLKKLLESSVPETRLPCKLPWVVTSDSEDDSWLLQSPLEISRKLQVSPPIPQQSEVVQQSNLTPEVQCRIVDTETKSPILDDVISISEESSCSIVIDAYVVKKTAVTSKKASNNVTCTSVDSCTYSDFRPLFPPDQENHASSPAVVTVSMVGAAKTSHAAPLTELTNNVPKVSSPEICPCVYRVVSPIKDNSCVKARSNSSNEIGVCIKETVKPASGDETLPSSDKQYSFAKHSPNGSLRKKNFQRRILTPEDVNKFKTGNVVNAFALMMSQAKKLI